MAKKLCLLLLVLSMAACDEQDSLPVRVVCVANDGSTIHSSYQDYWALDSRSGDYTPMATGTVFHPRPGDECHTEQKHG